MRRVAYFVTAALTGAAAFGQGLLDCIEPDVLRALVLQSQGERPPVFSADVPPEIAALKVPGVFTWIGSAERITGRVDATTNASQVTAAWRSGLAPDAARAAAAAALAASGWEVRAPMGMAVFSSAASQVPQAACRDGKPVNFAASALDGTTYLMFTLQRGTNSNSICSQPARPSVTTGTGLDQHLPRLQLPVDPSTGTEARMQSGGSGSGGGGFNAHAEFVLRDSASNVARQFARQMAEQGWTSDATWSGASSAGSSWSKREGGAAVVQGTLSVIALDERQFVATLRVSSLQ